ncbi:MAG: hypothetical protein ACYDCL_19880 [Myxococcales bacterium]
MKPLSSLALSSVAAGALAACAAPRMLMTPLRWNPSDDMGELKVVKAEYSNGWGGTVQMTGPDMSDQVADAFAGQRLQIMPFTDARTIKNAIGQNLQDGAPRPVMTPDDVAAYVTRHVADVIRACRVQVVPTEGTRTLQGEVTEFFVREDNSYKASVMLRVTLTEASGQTIWTGSVHGEQNKWGKSFSADNYNEDLSDSLVRAVHQLLLDPAFLAAAHRGR